MTLASLLLFTGALFVAAGSPGPSIAALVARVLARGLSDVLPFLFAMWVGEAIWLSLAVWGLAYVAQSFAFLFVLLKWVGVFYLLFLAWKMWNAPSGGQEGDLPKSRSALSLFTAGLAVTLGNPKIALFYMALLPTLIDLAAVTPLGWLELVAAMLLVLAAVDLGWAVAAARARCFLRTPSAMRLANRTGGVAMAGAAVTIASR